MNVVIRKAVLTLIAAFVSTGSRDAAMQWPSFLWSDPGLAPALKELKTTLMQENPQDHINNVLIPVSTFWGKQFADLRNGSLSDIGTFYDPDVRAYIERGSLERLADYLSAANIDRGSFLPTTSLGQKYGHIYAAPVVANARALFYNTKLFRQARTQPPKETATFLEAEKGLRKPELRQFGFATASKPSNASLMFIEVSSAIHIKAA
ncbi:MAG: extracellular solute-binding protein [Mesorhizobium sp.]|uniref:ABC transporter substrate-binding protein n=1 Tax=Mesorhizobium sp. TaxID=1871066 RepID=UPI000FE63FE5|nr:extracellular solute-binding protein [Mesorhizobium sp.]RWO31838.1 MAG: extracellular solute-binding protein [Mesorhizobium sp.]